MASLSFPHWPATRRVLGKGPIVFGAAGSRPKPVWIPRQAGALLPACCAPLHSPRVRSQGAFESGKVPTSGLDLTFIAVGGLPHPMRSDADRLEELERVLLSLRQRSDEGTLVVEGARDVAALEALGIGGHIVRVHGRRSLVQVMDDLADAASPIVLLLDWDRTGTRLARRIEEALVGRVTVDVESRRKIASACRAKCLEDVPAELDALRRAVATRGA